MRTPYQSAQFSEKYRKWARVTKATMRIQHKPGDTMEVDWAGDPIPVFTPVTGEETKSYLFIAVLLCSCYVYAKACSDMKTKNWLQCHVNAYRYLGGVARLLIPDNCKTATTSNTRYDTILNRSYNELSEHYGTAVVPARVRNPKEKSHAEGSVRFAETWIIAALRDRKFFTLNEVREAVAEKLAELNKRPIIEETLTYCDFPSEHWTLIRSNNVIERLNRESRRRTRVVGSFPDGNSALMLVCARLRHVAGTSGVIRKT